jgi:hypothetical protein
MSCNSAGSIAEDELVVNQTSMLRGEIVVQEDENERTVRETGNKKLQTTLETNEETLLDDWVKVRSKKAWECLERRRFEPRWKNGVARCEHSLTFVAFPRPPL